MEQVIAWLCENKEWFFSGAGLTIIWVIWLVMRCLCGKKHQSSKQAIKSGDHSVNIQAGEDITIGRLKVGDINIFNDNTPTHLVDREIEREVDKIKKSRFFDRNNGVELSINLGNRLSNGDLSGGSLAVKGPALAWCARVLSVSQDNTEQANKFLEQARVCGNHEETKIAEAFIRSAAEDKAAALQLLANIDSDASRSASFIIVRHKDGAKGAIEWMNNAGYITENLEPDGKGSLLICQLELGQWDEAMHTVNKLSETDFEISPILHYIAGMAKLLSVVHENYRHIVLTQVPFEAKDFPLASDVNAMATRNSAHEHFINGEIAARQLACLHSARACDEYALWLELRDPDQHEYGIYRLECKFNNSNDRLRYVHYALQYGFEVNVQKIEQEIQQEIARNGGITLDAAIARFALAFTQNSPEDIADYIARHQNQLANYIDPKLMLFRRVEMLTRAGLIGQARELCEQAVDEGITDQERDNLLRIISNAQGTDSIESIILQYESSKNLDDLINLFAKLEEHKHWDDMCKYGKILFEKTGELRYAERLVSAFTITHRSMELVNFLNDNASLLQQSDYIQIYYTWGLYNNGAILKSFAELEKCNANVEAQSYLFLKVNLGIAMGDWASLTSYIAAEYQNRANRKPYDLMRTAQLALYLGSDLTREFIFEAVAKAKDDPNILSGAYYTAANAGWEDEPEVSQWIEKAVALSNDNGPLQRVSLKDILDMKPDWESPESKTCRMLEQNQIPISLAARSTNRTLISLMVFPALTNINEVDPRKRGLIPAYSGKRGILEMDNHGKSMGFDVTTLLTLSFLGILDKTLDAFNTVWIPHSTLGWLFEEQHKATFHQPSRITYAKDLQSFLSTGVLEKFVSTAVASSDLSAQVGNNLAEMIAEAEKIRPDDDTQHIIVRPGPVNLVSSLMDEIVDLSSHGSVLSSCLSIVEKLNQKGIIASEEKTRAKNYLLRHEEPWPDQPEILDGATLYLDSLAVTYFQHLGFLDKLKKSGFKVFISQSEVSEANALISYESISGAVKNIIENIRDSLRHRIESGRVKMGHRKDFDEDKGQLIPGDPLIDIFALVNKCDAIIIDDRFFNQKRNIDIDGLEAPVFSTLDLLDALTSANVISENECLEYRTKLRRAGYFFIPVSEAELERHIKAATIADGRLVETTELKAIRESILHVRMRDWLQLPDEAPWLVSIFNVFTYVLKNLWKDKGDLNKAEICSDWLYRQIDFRGWVHNFIPEHADDIARVRRAEHIVQFLSPPMNVERCIVEAYWNWLEDRVLLPLNEQFPEVYNQLVDRYRNHIVGIIETPLPKIGEIDEHS